jgi:twitching motility protein PilT
MTIKDYLAVVIKQNASDLHLVVGNRPTIRIDGLLLPFPDSQVLTQQEAERLIFELLTEEQKELFLVNKEIDFSFALGEVARFRVNAYYQKGYMAAALRLIPMKIKGIEDLNLPQVCHRFAELRQGFILVTGPTGHGKSTTIAAIINEINQSRPVHILTIEDPIEYVFPPGKAIVSQRELHLDTHSWEIALRSALREDPDIVLIGEMRDYETTASAITIAETGHLVMATLHTNSAAQTIDRIIDQFPEHQQAQVRLQLSMTLGGIISQRLVPLLEGGRYPATEILLANSAVRTVIRDGKTHQIDNIIQTSAEIGMITMDKVLANLTQEGRISMETATSFAVHPEEVIRLLRGK